MLLCCCSANDGTNAAADNSADDCTLYTTSYFIVGVDITTNNIVEWDSLMCELYIVGYYNLLIYIINDKSNPNGVTI